MCCKGKEKAVFCVSRGMGRGGYYLSQYGNLNSYYVPTVLHYSDL